MWPGLLRILFGPGPVPARFNAFPVWMVLRPSQIRASAAESALLVPSAVALSRRYHELKMPVFIMAGDATGSLTQNGTPRACIRRFRKANLCSRREPGT